MSKKRTCLICKKGLSMYNTEEYCFAHHREGQLIKDEAYKEKCLANSRKHALNRYYKQKEVKDAGSSD